MDTAEEKVLTIEEYIENSKIPLVQKPKLEQHSSFFYSAYVLLILLVTYSWNMASRTFPSVVGVAMMRDLGMSDTVYGLMNGILFNGVFIIAGLLISRYADLYNRKIIFGFCTLFWSAMVSLSGLSTRYWHMILFRVGIAVGMSASHPIAYSLIADYFLPSNRGTVIAIYSTGAFFGIGASFALGSLTHVESSDWKNVLFYMGIPSSVLAICILLTIKEPRRGRLDIEFGISDYTAKLKESLKYILTKWSFICIAIAASLRYFTGSGFGSWVPTYLTRVLNVTPQELGKWLSWSSAGIGFIGVISGGIISDKWAKMDQYASIYICAISTFLCIPFTILVLLHNDRLVVILAGLVPYYFISQMWTGAAGGIIANCAPATMRTYVTSIYFTVLQFIGGFGPPTIGMLNEVFFKNPIAIRHSMLIVLVVAYVLSIVFFVLALCRLKKDLDSVNHYYNNLKNNHENHT